MNKLIYAYGISHGSPPGNILKLPGLRATRFQDFCIFNEEVPPDEFSEENLARNFSDLSWLERKTRHHVQVLLKLMEHRTVVPFKFATIFETRKNLGKFISRYSDLVGQNLSDIEGKEEWSIKVYADSGTLASQMPAISKSVSSLDREIAESSPGKAFILRQKRNEAVKQEAEKARKHFGQQCYSRIAAASKAVQLNHLVPKKLTGRSDDMILNMACLAEKHESHVLVTAASHWRKRNRKTGFDLEISGPWPPFSFISMDNGHAK